MNEHILIIDDNVANLKVAINTLEAHDYTVLIARNGQDGFVRAKYAQPDLILLDIMLPDMDGYTVCQQLKADEYTWHIPVIFISVLDEVFDKVTAFSSGGVDYVTKPFQTEELLARVQTHLTLHQLQQELQVANETLESKVYERTVALTEVNAQLQYEIEQREQEQQEKNHLFAVVAQQSDQLRHLTTLLIQSQQLERQGLAVDLQHEIAENIMLLQSSVMLAEQLLGIDNRELVAEQLRTADQILAQMGQYITQVTNYLPQLTLQEQDAHNNPLLKLTDREREVLQLLAQGKSNTEMSDLLNISVASVYTYNRRIKEKLNLYDVPSLTRLALHYQLVE